MKRLIFLSSFLFLSFWLSNATAKAYSFNNFNSKKAYYPIRTISIKNGTSGSLSVSIGGLSYYVAPHSTVNSSFSLGAGTFTAYISCTDPAFGVSDNLGHSVISNPSGVAIYTLNGPFSGYYEVNVSAA